MKIDKNVYRYIEFELYNYEQYKKEIEIERNSVIESSPCFDGQPRGYAVGSPTENKCIQLLTSKALKSMQNVVTAVENMKKRLTETHYKLFLACYVQKRRDRYSLCDELGIAEATFTRYKHQVVEFIGLELGVIKS